jgi:hypothetical protein
VKEVVIKIQFDDNKREPINADYIRGCLDDCCVDYIDVLDVLSDVDKNEPV